MDQVGIPQQFNPNVIVFGETGAGKSSVINMVLGSDRANVSNRLLGETFKSTVYPIELDGLTYNLYDTVGLGEHSGGTVDSAKAIRNLYRLVTDLSNSGGVNLLVFVMKRGRLTETIYKNYDLFHHGFCNSNVPIVVVVTGCEDIEPTMDRWWIDNSALLTKAGMSFDGHACVCAFKGRKTNTGGYRNEELVNESVGVVKHLIVQSCMSNGWEKPSIVWFQQVIGAILKLFRTSKVPTIYANLYSRLANVFSTSEAEDAIATVLGSNSMLNVIVFGEMGAGKSSVINMILGSHTATVGNRALPETRKSTGFQVGISGETYNIYDTVGVGEYSGGNPNALRNLYCLVTDLSNSGGVNLLVFVFKCGSRLTETMHKNYSLLYHGFCDSKVPIVIVVTGCENVEPTMDRWWTVNEPSFTNARMSFAGHPCVCACKGTKTNYGFYRNEDLFDESVEVVRQLIVRCCMRTGWKNQLIDSLRYRVAYFFRLSKIPAGYMSLFDRLKNIFSSQEAENIIEVITTGHKPGTPSRAQTF